MGEDWKDEAEEASEELRAMAMKLKGELRQSLLDLDEQYVKKEGKNGNVMLFIAESWVGSKHNLMVMPEAMLFTRQEELEQAQKWYGRWLELPRHKKIWWLSMVWSGVCAVFGVAILAQGAVFAAHGKWVQGGENLLLGAVNGFFAWKSLQMSPVAKSAEKKVLQALKELKETLQ